MLDPPEVTPYDLRCASIKVNFWLKELTSKNQSAGDAAKKCLPTQFLVAVDTESDADSALSLELDSVRQDIAVQKAVLEAHTRLLREAKASKQPRHVRKQRATDYQRAMEKLSHLNLKARHIRGRMSSAEWQDDDSISQSSSFAFYNGIAAGGDAASSVTGSSAYHSSPRNPGGAADCSSSYYSESLLSGQMYDARSLLSDLSRESSVRSAVSANAPLGSSATSYQGRQPAAAMPVPPQRQQQQQQQPQQPHLQQHPVVPRRSGLCPNARSGSNWRRSNSMGNLLADQQQPPPPPPAPQPSFRQPSNTSFPGQHLTAQEQQAAPYRRIQGHSASYRYQPRKIADASFEAAAGGAAAGPQLTASHQSPYWYTPRSRLEPVAAAPQPQPRGQRPRHQQSDL